MNHYIFGVFLCLNVMKLHAKVYRNNCHPLKREKLSYLQVLHIQHQAAHSNKTISIYPKRRQLSTWPTLSNIQVWRPPPWTPFEGSPPQRAGRLPGQCQAANQLTGGPSYMPPKAPHPQFSVFKKGLPTCRFATHEKSSGAHQILLHARLC